MTLRQLNVLQWIGVVVPPLAWAAQHVAGSGEAQGICSPGGYGWGVTNEAWQLSIVGAAVVVILAAEAAAVAVFRATRGEDPEKSRLHFMATGAIVANALFLAIVLLSGLTSGLENGCVQS
jgi:hypothetical protein